MSNLSKRSDGPPPVYEPVQTKPQVIQALELTANDLLSRAHLVSQLLSQVLVKDVHYGTIPGTQKPALYKSGAEKLLMAFMVAPQYEVTDLSGPDFCRYRIHAKGFHQVTGNLLGAGLGECSSEEERYKWQQAVNQKDFDNTEPKDRRVKQYPNREALQIRTQAADKANTVLKMAKKRALSDLCLTVTACSDMFEVADDDTAANHPGGSASRQTSATSRASQGSSSQNSGGGGWDGPASSAQMGAVSACLAKADPDLSVRFCHAFELDTLEQLTKGQADRVIKTCNGGLEPPPAVE